MADGERYRRTVKETEKELETSIEKGLSTAEVERRTQKYGPNRIEMEEPPSWFSFFLRHLREFVSILLIIVAAIALAIYFLEPHASIDRLGEGVIILFIVVLNATVGAHQEHRSEQTSRKLMEMMKTKAEVLRDGEYAEVDSEELVPGDIVLLETGDKVPADLRLVDTNELQVTESVLTGESRPVSKTVQELAQEAPLAERKCTAYTNTYVTRGEATGIVVGTGSDTEMGVIAEASRGAGEKEVPFTSEVQTAAKTISYLAVGCVVVASILFALAGKSPYDIFMLGAALVIGSIPAALPVTVTSSLTNAMRKMAEVNVLVKNMPMLETIGGVDVICTDKTGTLTENKMSIRKFILPGTKLVDDADGFDFSSNVELARCALLANEAEQSEDGFIGDPEDVGLLEFLESKGMKYESEKGKYEQRDFLPFSSKRKMVQSLVSSDGHTFRYSKGAPEVILARSSGIMVDGRISKLTDDWKRKMKDYVRQFSQEALRVLAFSYKEVEGEGVGEKTSGDVFLGVVGMWDPPKRGVREAVETCYRAGMEVKMITGDNQETAEAIARVCGFRNIHAVSWEDVRGASDNEMEELVQSNNVFARMDPALKMGLVKALHRLGKRVAITGDGVNDTPPIEEAEVGIAMGKRGSDITRGAADIILLDDSFPSIVNGIREGRTVLSNVRKVVNYLLTANLFEVVALVVSSFFGFTPFVAIQILWVNFATDIFPAISLGMDPSHPGIMDKSPTGKGERILTKRIWYLLVGIGLKKVVLLLLTFLVVLWISKGDTKVLGIQGNIAMGQTAAFLWLGLSHFVRIAAIRWDEGWKGRDVFINKWVNYSLLWPIVAFLIIFYTPLHSFFEAVPLPLWVWGVVGATITAGVFLAILISLLVTRIVGEYGQAEY